MNALFTRKSKYYLIFIIGTFSLLLLCTPGSLFAQKQTKSELEDKKKKIQQEIDMTNQLLSETKLNKKISMNLLLTLNKKLSARQELINAIRSQIGLLNKEVGETSRTIEDLEAELKKLKDNYAKLIYKAWKSSDGYSRLMFIFASTDFNQAYIRLKYLQQYGEYRHKEADQIVKTQNELNAKLLELQSREAEKRTLLGSEETEKEVLTKEKSEKEVVLMDLQSKEKQLKADLSKKRKDAEKLQQAIMRIIKEEIEKANAGKTKVESNRLVLTPEAQKLSNSFSSNKGKLPWPVIEGVVIDRFGPHPHPTMPDITIDNHGVDIATTKGALARAVFDGEVTAVVNFPGSGKAVIVRHGEYLSVYANLNEVYIKTGDKIKTKQNIGNILLDENEGKTELHLEIWKGQTKLDPEEWMFKN